MVDDHHSGSSFRVDTTFTDVYVAQCDLWKRALTAQRPSRFYDVVSTGFSDSSCTQTFSQFYSRGTYHLFSPSTTISGAFNMEITSMDKRLILANTTADAAGFYHRMCPNETFVAETYMDVRFFHCPMFDLFDDRLCPVRYEVIAITPGEIRFGLDPVDQERSCNQAGRATTLGPIALKSVYPQPALDAVGAGVLIGVVAFVVGALLFGTGDFFCFSARVSHCSAGIICGCCCFRRATAGGRAGENTYHEPLNMRS
jgi:hypothetical protein